MQPTTDPRVLQRGMVVLRTYLGLVFLSNGLAKLFGFHALVIGPFFNGGLIDSGSARSQLRHAADATFIPVLADVAHFVAAGGWPVFGPLLTIAELALGLGLLSGVLVRWAAIGGLLLFVPIWVMIWPTHDYLWDYPGDLVPLLVFAVAPVPSRTWVRFLDRSTGSRRRVRRSDDSSAETAPAPVAASGGPSQ